MAVDSLHILSRRKTNIFIRNGTKKLLIKYRTFSTIFWFFLGFKRCSHIQDWYTEYGNLHNLWSGKKIVHMGQIWAQRKILKGKLFCLLLLLRISFAKTNKIWSSLCCKHSNGGFAIIRSIHRMLRVLLLLLLLLRHVFTSSHFPLLHCCQSHKCYTIFVIQDTSTVCIWEYMYVCFILVLF